MQRKVLLIILVLALVSGLMSIVQAIDPDPYQVTIIYPAGAVPLGGEAKIEATTTDLSVTFIGVTWIDPSGKAKSYQEFWTSSGLPVESTQTLDVLGNWYVKVVFVDYSYGPDSAYYVLANHDVPFEVRSNSVNTVPEVPLIGTIGITAAMVVGLATFLLKKKQLNPSLSQ